MQWQAIVKQVLIVSFLIIFWPAGIIYCIMLFMKHKYFQSEGFLHHKSRLEETISEFNEISIYADNIKNYTSFREIDNNLRFSNLASFENTSRFRYRRDRYVRDDDVSNVHASSLSIVRRASEEPIKYLCKYFNFTSTQGTLDELLAIGENISRVENAIINLNERKKEIQDEFNPPFYITTFFNRELMDRIGFIIPEIEFEYSEYVFHYLSAGGNSSQKTVIYLNGEIVEALSEYISDKIKYNKSVKGQRALMTNYLRNIIKERDHYTCQQCGASIHEQSLLLLEVDHIIPISKGGTSTPGNLQTLCWKCNRTKSNKII